MRLPGNISATPDSIDQVHYSLATLVVLVVPLVCAVLFGIIEFCFRPARVRGYSMVSIWYSTFVETVRKTYTRLSSQACVAADEENGLAVSQIGYGTFADFDGVQAAAHHELSDDADSIKSPVALTSTASSATLNHSWRTDMTLVRKLCNTRTGQVNLMRLPSGNLVVVKSLPLSRTANRRPVPDPEPILLRQHLFPHINLIFCYGSETDLHSSSTPTDHIILEYCSRGDLFDFFHYWQTLYATPLPEIFLLHFVAGMVRALAYIHHGMRAPTDGDSSTHKPIVHRDIKLDNIFLRYSPYSRHNLPDIVLADFGGAVFEEGSRGTCGTIGYFPPEMESLLALEDTDPDAFDRVMDTETVITTASDVYTFGVTLYILLTSRPYNRETSSVYDAIDQSDLTAPWDSEIKALLLDCLDLQPTNRPTAREAYSLLPRLEQRMAELHASGLGMEREDFLESEVARRWVREKEAEMAERERSLTQARSSSGSGGMRSSSSFCLFPNHGKLSARVRGVECVGEATVGGGYGDGSFDDGVGAETRITVVEREEVVMSAFSESSDGSVYESY